MITVGFVRGLSTDLKKLLFTVAFNAVGNGLVFVLLLVYLIKIRHIHPSQATLLLTWMAIIGISSTGVVGWLVDRFGQQHVMMAGLLIAGIGSGSWALVHAYPQAIIVATIVGIGNASIWPPQSALVARLAAVDVRPTIYALQFMLLNAGLGIGGVLCSFVIVDGNAASFERLYIIDACTYFVGVFLISSIKGARGREVHDLTEEEASHGYREVFADRRFLRLAIGSTLMIVFGYASIEAGLTLLASVHMGLSAKWLGVIFGVNTAIIVLAQPLSLRIANGRSRVGLLAGVGVLWASSWLVTAVASAVAGFVGGIILAIAQIFFALGETVWSPIAPALANDLAPPHLRGRYNAVGALQWGTANILGPLLSGALLGNGFVLAWISVVFVGCLFASFIILGTRHLLTAQEDGRAVASA